jgi:hypothetical protein
MKTGSVAIFLLVAQGAHGQPLPAHDPVRFVNSPYGFEVALPRDARVCEYGYPKGNHQVDVILRRESDCDHPAWNDLRITIYAGHSFANDEGIPPVRREIALVACARSRPWRMTGFGESRVRMARLPTFECRRRTMAANGQAFGMLSLVAFRGSGPYPDVEYSMWIEFPMELSDVAEKRLYEFARGVRLRPFD